MIYSFDREDPAQKKFLDLLEANRLDYELCEFDRSVIRILGAIPQGLEDKLMSIYSGRRTRGVDSEKTAGDIYSEFLDRTGPIVIAGPCAIESKNQISSVASFLQGAGVRFMRGGAFKPRTSPGSFQGMGKTGLKLIFEEARKFGLKVVSEVMDKSQIEMLVKYADIIQVGSRNMFNYTLLTALGSTDKPVLLKRGMGATIDEWLSASEYIQRGGNRAIILCERGIRTFEPKTRNTLDISAICLARKLTHYPVIADPSHATGDAELVTPVAMAALSAGADGIMVEIHPDPEKALSDREQALSFSQFEILMEKIARQHDHQNG